MLLLRLNHVTKGVAAGPIGAKVLPSAARCCGSHRRQHLSNIAAVLESRAVIEIRYGTMMHVAVSCACLHHSLRNGEPRVPKFVLFPREIKVLRCYACCSCGLSHVMPMPMWLYCCCCGRSHHETAMTHHTSTHFLCGARLLLWHHTP